MLDVLVFKNGSVIKLPLDEFLDEYHQNPPEGWHEELKEFVNVSLSISNEQELNQFLSKMNLRWFNYKNVKLLYQNLKNSNYSSILEDDILRYISFLYGLGCFERMNIQIDEKDPDLDPILKPKFLFHPMSVKNQISEDNMFSILDLIPLKNGMNAIRSELIKAKKW